MEDKREWTAIADDIYRAECEVEADVIRRQMAEDAQGANIDQQGGSGMLGGPSTKKPTTISEQIKRWEDSQPLDREVLIIVWGVLHGHRNWMPPVWRAVTLIDEWVSLDQIWYYVGKRYLLNTTVLDQAKRETNAQLRELGLG